MRHDYTALDAAIVECIRRRRDGADFTHLVGASAVRGAAEPIAFVRGYGRSVWRVVDGRLQALRKSGVIAYTRRGWVVAKG